MERNDGYSASTCKTCWTLTDSFHQLYELVQKTAADLSNVSVDTQSTETKNAWPDKSAAAIECKVEVRDEPGPESDSSESRNLLMDGNQSDSSSSDSDAPLLAKAKRQRKGKRKTNTRVSVDGRKRATNQRMEEENQQIRDFFSMNCDLCETTFLTINDATIHYKRTHNKSGYLKCCDKKFYQRCLVLEHIQQHLDPPQLKY